MAPYVPPGEPRQAPKPQPLGNSPFIFLFTATALCAMFLLWRRASSLRTVVSHQLKTWNRHSGNIRLSTDDGPPASSFLGDDSDDENEVSSDDDALTSSGRAQSSTTRYPAPVRFTDHALPELPRSAGSDAEAPPLPPKL